MSTPRPGRRIAEARPGQVNRGAVAAVVLVVLAALAVLLTGSDNFSGNRAVRGVGVLVDHAVDGCPRFAPPPGTRTTVITGAAPVDDLGSDGSLRHGEPGQDLASAKQQTPARGELLRLEPGADDPPSLAVEATGDLAAGLFTFEVDTGRDDTTAVTECASPAARWWFTGGGATLDHSSELVLSNVDPGPAVVDVRVFGLDGEIETTGARGITVPPEERTTIALTDVAPQGEELAVSVVTSRGRVVAAMSDSFAPELGANTGADWVPAQTSPSRVVRLAGLPGRADSHSLVLANPSELEALVEVEVSGESGSFAPTDDAQVRVPPGSVVSTDITETIGTDASAVTLRSTVPVTATVRSVADGDSSYAGSVRALTGPAVAPAVADGTSTLQLSAGQRSASADVTAYDEDGGKVESTTVEIPAGATSTWSPGQKADYLVVTPKQGQTLGAVSFAGGAGLSQVPLHSLEVRVDQPVVRPALR